MQKATSNLEKNTLNQSNSPCNAIRHGTLMKKLSLMFELIGAPLAPPPDLTFLVLWAYKIYPVTIKHSTDKR